MADIPEEVAFEVHAGGAVYRVFGSGRIEGFPEGAVIFNRIPRLLLEASGAERERCALIAECWPMLPADESDVLAAAIRTPAHG